MSLASAAGSPVVGPAVARVSPPLRAAVVLFFGLAVAACGGDSGSSDAAISGADADPADATVQVIDAGPPDSSSTFPDGGIAGSITELLPGRWEAVGISDSGDGVEPVPAGNFVVFDNEDAAFSCGGPGNPWSIVAANQIHLDFGGGSGVDWYILTLDAEDFVFGEGGDVFYYKRRDPCPL